MRTARGFELRADGVGVLQLQPTAHARNLLDESGFTAARRCAGVTWNVEVYGAWAEMRLAGIAYDEALGRWCFVTRPPPVVVLRAGMPPRPELWQLRATLERRLRWLLIGGAYAASKPNPRQTFSGALRLIHLRRVGVTYLGLQGADFEASGKVIAEKIGVSRESGAPGLTGPGGHTAESP